MKKINHGGRLTSSFLLLALMVYMIGCVGVGTAEPINPNNEGQDPYDWSNYPGEVILDAPEFIQGDDHDGLVVCCYCHFFAPPSGHNGGSLRKDKPRLNIARLLYYNMKSRFVKT